jgi:hypothetical protein
MATKKGSKTPPAKKAPPKAKPAPPAKASPAAKPAVAAKKAALAAPARPTPAPAKKLVKPKRERGAAPGRGARPLMGGGDRHSRLGQKWGCFKCGAKFYDLNQPEPRCPKCGTDQRTRPKDQPATPPPPPPRPREPRPLALLDDDDATRDDEALGPEDLDLEFAGIGEEEDLGDAPDLGIGEEEEEAGEEE